MTRALELREPLDTAVANISGLGDYKLKPEEWQLL
jgi:hypothetical protein